MTCNDMLGFNRVQRFFFPQGPENMIIVRKCVFRGSCLQASYTSDKGILHKVEGDL